MDLSDAFMHDWMKKMKGEAPLAEVLSSVKLNDFRQILNGEILENRYFDAFFVDKDGIEIGITYHYPGDGKKSSAESGCSRRDSSESCFGRGPESDTSDRSAGTVL